MRHLLVAAGLLAVASAPTAADPADTTMEQVRVLFARGSFREAKALLARAYAATPSPELLFALGQVAFNLDEFAQAIAYYEKFLTSNPDPDQAALAQQAIGAARARIAAPVAPPPPPAPLPPELRRHWEIEQTGVVVIGATALVIGTGLIYEGRRQSYNQSGLLSDYDMRLDRARTDQRIGLACSLGGALVIGAAIVVWGVRREEVPRLAPTATEGGAGVTFGGTW